MISEILHCSSNGGYTVYPLPAAVCVPPNVDRRRELSMMNIPRICFSLFIKDTYTNSFTL